MKSNSGLSKYYNSTKYYHLIPLIVLVIFVPLMVRLKVIPLSGVTYHLWTGQKENYDFYSYYKAAWTIFLACLSLFMLGVKYFQNDLTVLKKTHYYIPILIYIVLVSLSTLTSQYRAVAISGFADRYEGYFVILAYMLILFTAINLVSEEKHVKVIIISLFIGVAIVCTIGIFQYIGYDLWKSSIGKEIMLPKEYLKYADQLKFQFAKYQIYSTLYHYNYVGSYTAMFLPISLTLLIFLKSKFARVLLGILTLMIGINMLGSNARSGIIGFGFSLIVLIVILHRFLIKNWKNMLLIIGTLIILFTGLNAYSNGRVAARISTLLSDMVSIGTKSDKGISYEDIIPLKDVRVENNQGIIVTNTETLKVELMNQQIIFKSPEDKPLQAKIVNGKFVFLDSRYKDYIITLGKIDNKSAISVKKGQIQLWFDISENKVKLIDNKGYEINTIEVEKWGFEGKEKLGSSRGFIWSRSIPLLKNTILLGHGPDTFAIYFPQNDIKGKMYAYDGDMWQIVDKPHDMYLQAAINTGVLSLIALLVLFIMYFIESTKIFIKNEYSDFLNITGLAIFVGVCGYLGAGIFNDSIVSVAPLFWVMLGMGISVNSIIKRNISKQTTLNNKNDVNIITN